MSSGLGVSDYRFCFSPFFAAGQLICANKYEWMEGRDSDGNAIKQTNIVEEELD